MGTPGDEGVFQDWGPCGGGKTKRDRASILGKLQQLKRKCYSTTAFGFHAVPSE